MIPIVNMVCGHTVTSKILTPVTYYTETCSKCAAPIYLESLNSRVTFLKEGAKLLSAMAITAAVFRGSLTYTYMHLFLGYILCCNRRYPEHSTELPLFTITDNLGAVAYGMGAGALILEDSYGSIGVALVDISTLFLLAQFIGETLALWGTSDR